MRTWLTGLLWGLLGFGYGATLVAFGMAFGVEGASFVFILATSPFSIPAFLTGGQSYEWLAIVGGICFWCGIYGISAVVRTRSTRIAILAALGIHYLGVVFLCAHNRPSFTSDPVLAVIYLAGQVVVWRNTFREKHRALVLGRGGPD